MVCFKVTVRLLMGLLFDDKNSSIGTTYHSCRMRLIYALASPPSNLHNILI